MPNCENSGPEMPARTINLSSILLILLLVINAVGIAFVSPIGAQAEPFSTSALPAAMPDGAADLNKMSVAELKQFANDRYWADDYESARRASESLIEKSHCSLSQLDHECLELYMNLAVCLMQERKLDEAGKILDKLLKFARLEKNDTNNGMDEPDSLFFLAECNYRKGAYKKAEAYYQEALAEYRKVLPKFSADLSPCIDGLVGCVFRRNDYAAALPLFIELVQIDALNRGVDNLTTAWSLLNLYHGLNKLNRDSDADPLFDKAVYIFRQNNADRIFAKLSAGVPESERGALRKRVRSYVFGLADRQELDSGGKMFQELMKNVDLSRKPPQRTYDFYNWRMKRTRVTDAPGIVTVDTDAPLKGWIICVHGLGLHHGTYQNFAGEMCKRGFGVVAFDVRGFGSYRENKGYDRVDLKDSVEDIGGILELMRRDYPDRSIFLLGESMGGALALQCAGGYSRYIDGLVCSVPSGSRFGAATTNARVAMRLLTNKNKPFDIGKRIVKQATAEESLRQQWKQDPEARLTLSPLELVQFQQFMNQNLKAAAKLKGLPVVIFQGYGDKLVKPEGTLDLYNALLTEDKDLIFVGHSEHLIFEEGQFKPSVINGLNGWLCSHLRD